MESFNFSDCRKATNQAIFRPTAARKAAAAKLLQEALDFINNLEEVAEKPSKKAGKKRRRKTTKRTPSQKVADAQDRAALKTNEVGPIKPSKKAKTASVKEAAAAAKAVSVATGAAAKAAKKAQLKAEAEATEAKASKVASKKPTQAQRLSSLEDKIEMLTNLLALQMQGEQGTSVDAVSIEELPFEL
jgi:hypothetical protein|tara:strand:+ start:48701 stop:49264 length:564 start_codon:yes stop_codon:yes gene_type:complete